VLFLALRFSLATGALAGCCSWQVERAGALHGKALAAGALAASSCFSGYLLQTWGCSHHGAQIGLFHGLDVGDGTFARGARLSD
jgi:hypothetical protein